MSPKILRSDTLIWLCALQDNLQRGGAGSGREGVFSMIKDLKKRATNLVTIICFNNEFSDYLFQLWILFYLVVQAYHETLHTINHSESEVKFFKY